MSMPERSACAIYTFCFQICDPQTTGAFWQTWKDFEVRYSNKDTIREMLCIPQSIQATYNTQVNFMAHSCSKCPAAQQARGRAA